MSVRLVQRILIVSMLIAASGLLLMNLLGTSGERQVAAAQPAREYPVIESIRPIKQGQFIRPGDVGITMKSAIPPGGSFQRVDEVEGRIARRDIPAVTVVSPSSVITRDVGTLAHLVPQGLRAVALRVTDDSAVANLIQPGDRIDVMTISNNAASQLPGVTPADRTARTILQNIQVLAVGDAMIGEAANSTAYRNVTMALTPRQAAVLTVARTLGTQFLSLRAVDDEDVVDEAQSSGSITDLRWGNTVLAPPPPANLRPGAAAPRVEIIVGSKREPVQVSSEAGK